MPTLEDMKDQLRIDRDALDEELIRQPQLFSDVADAAAMALSVRDQMKDDLKILEAELDVRIRRKLEEAGEKSTEPQIKAKVQKHQERQTAVAKLLDSEAKAASWMALKEAYQQRSYVLKDLVSLYVAGYFQSGSAHGSGRKVREAEVAEAKEAVRKQRVRVTRED